MVTTSRSPSASGSTLRTSGHHGGAPRAFPPRSARTLALVAATACSVGLAATSHTLTSTWKAPGTGPLDFADKKVAALVITTDDGLRMSAEAALAREISARGPKGVAAYTVIPREELTDKEKAKSWFERSAIEGIVAMRIVGVDKSTSYSAVVWSSGYYNNFYDYYGNGWTTVTPIGKGRVDTTLAVETLLYQVSDARLLWASISETTNPKDAGTFMKGLVSAVVKELQKEGLVRKARN
jgi:hypothetical protein